MSEALGWLAAAFGVVWAALALYLWRLAREQRRIADRISRIEGRADDHR
ncbi:MAG TPA: CcmD family protein [Actinomycetota bacterium]|nr:CcmD family protein [Actinomycetota bacterium]